jgi:hypothetical protein
MAEYNLMKLPLLHSFVFYLVLEVDQENLGPVVLLRPDAVSTRVLLVLLIHVFVILPQFGQHAFRLHLLGQPHGYFGGFVNRCHSFEIAQLALAENRLGLHTAGDMGKFAARFDGKLSKALLIAVKVLLKITKEIGIIE